MTEPILAALPADTKPDGRQAGDLKLGSDEFFHRAQQRLNFVHDCHKRRIKVA